MNNSIKRAQSQACLGFAERKNFRPLARHLKQLTMTLLLLITATAGAWAQEATKGTVTFMANGKTVTKTDVTLPYTVECNFPWTELDYIII